MPSHRVAQISEQLRRELGPLLAEAFEDFAGVLITVTSVKAAADLQNATVWVSILPNDDYRRVLRRLQHQAATFRAALFSAVRFRPVPTLHFRYDVTGMKAADVESLLNRLEHGSASPPASPPLDDRSSAR